MIAGSLVTLRPPSTDDADVLYRVYADLETWEERSPRAPRAMTRAEFRARFEKSLADDTDVEFVISADDRAIGRVAIFGEDPLARHAEIGVAMLPEARGRGFGTDALNLVCEFAFVRRNLRRLYLHVIASNAAAIASYTQVGFVEEGRLREHCWVRGRYEDEVLMGLLRAEWRR